MNTKPCISSHNKRIIILIYTKDWSDTEGYKTIRISWPKKWPPVRFSARYALTGHSSLKQFNVIKIKIVIKILNLKINN